MEEEGVRGEMGVVVDDEGEVGHRFPAFVYRDFEVVEGG